MTIHILNTGVISGNNVLVYNGNVLGSTFSPVGAIQKIIFKGGDARAAGSLFVYESGVTLELLFQKVGALQTDSVHYPRVYPVDETNTSISGTSNAPLVPRIVAAPLVIVGSGWGNAGSTISGLVVYYTPL